MLGIKSRLAAPKAIALPFVLFLWFLCFIVVLNHHLVLMQFYDAHDIMHTSILPSTVFSSVTIRTNQEKLLRVLLHSYLNSGRTII